jgi:hypothetical protein
LGFGGGGEGVGALEVFVWWGAGHFDEIAGSKLEKCEDWVEGFWWENGRSASNKIENVDFEEC